MDTALKSGTTSLWQVSEDMMVSSAISSPTEQDGDSSTINISITTQPDTLASNGTVDPYSLLFESDFSVILDYVAVILFFMSLVGNSLIFAVFSLKDYKNNITAMMYRILALTDGLVVLLQDGLVTLSYVINGNSIFSYNSISCKAFGFTLHWFRAFSVWLMIIISAERFVCVWLPFRAKFFNTKRNYIVLTCVFLTMTCLLYIPLTLTTDRVVGHWNGREIGDCYLLGKNQDYDDYLKWYRDVFDEMNLVVCGFLPFILVSISNTAIIYGLRRSQSVRNSSTNQVRDCNELMNRNVTIMLCISSTSVVLSFSDPIYHWLPSSDEFRRTVTFAYFVPVFDSINRFINIVIISVFGKQFRKNVKRLVPYKFNSMGPDAFLRQ